MTTLQDLIVGKRLQRHHRNPLLKKFDASRWKEFRKTDCITLTCEDHAYYHRLLACNDAYGELLSSLADMQLTSIVDEDALDDIWDNFCANHPDAQLSSALNS